MTEKERMTAGLLYFGPSPELDADRTRKRELVHKINHTPIREELPPLFRELFGHLGENPWIEPPFQCDYGCNIHVGDNFYANFDCIILDVCDVTIGNDVFFAPRVCLFGATHPIDAGVRNSGLEYGKPITIGSSVWVGGNTVINPGVTIGDNVVIGSGSVVTRDIPSNVVAAGNPCRVLRPITEADRVYWETLARRYRENVPPALFWAPPEP